VDAYRFQLKLKDRTTAANILGDLLRNVIKKEDERGYHLSFSVMPPEQFQDYVGVMEKMSESFEI
jgi:hypothetical protein